MADRIRPSNSLLLLILLASMSALSACSDGSKTAGDEREHKLVLGFSPIVSWGGWSGANADSVSIKNGPVSVCAEWQRGNSNRLRAERCNGRAHAHARLALCRG